MNVQGSLRSAVSCRDRSIRRPKQPASSQHTAHPRSPYVSKEPMLIRRSIDRPRAVSIPRPLPRPHPVRIARPPRLRAPAPRRPGAPAIGGADRARTDDLRLARAALSQLSYSPFTPIAHRRWGVSRRPATANARRGRRGRKGPPGGDASPADAVRRPERLAPCRGGPR
jgi:hypothetical protein